MSENEIDKIFISKIHLSNYRNFKIFEHEFDQKPVLIIGENGVGKTNILESISLLSPGRGLHNAKFDELCRVDQTKIQGNAISNINITNQLGSLSFLSIFDHISHKRIIEFNGSKIPVKDLSQFMNITWITPDMTHIFTGARSNRLRFFDRIVYSFFPLHANLVNKYDHYLNERRILLKTNNYDEEWIAIIEKNLAISAFDIMLNRNKIIEKINNISQNSQFHFPKIHIKLASAADDLFVQDEETITLFVEKYQKNRKFDLDSGKSNFGPHRTELVATHLDENILASKSSMGQQKAILVSIILSQIIGLIEVTKKLPIILLDEVFVHLDKKRSIYLSEFLLDLGIQVWITDTGTEHIDFFINKSTIMKL
jgi:DNA replication and repair protein RecF